MDSEITQVNVSGVANFDGTLVLDFSDYDITDSKNVKLITANSIKGKFDNVVADGYNVTLVYSDSTVTAQIEPAE